MANATQTINDAWSNFCYFKKTKRNTLTDKEVFIQDGIYSPVYTGIYRVGEKRTAIDSTYEMIERTVYVFKPDLAKLFHSESLPNSVSFRIYISAIVFDQDYSEGTLTVKPWTNTNYEGWSSSSLVSSFEDITGYYIPTNLTTTSYSSSLYEVSAFLKEGDTDALFTSMKHSFLSYMKHFSIGFQVSGTNGYYEIFGIDYNENKSLRPTIFVNQTIPYESYSCINLDIEIAGRSLTIGTCRNKKGEIITGVNCKIAIYNITNESLVGSGISDANGDFRIITNCKSGETVLVTFVDESHDINGSELMKTFGSSSSSSYSSSSYSSSSYSSSSYSSSSYSSSSYSSSSYSSSSSSFSDSSSSSSSVS